MYPGGIEMELWLKMCRETSQKSAMGLFSKKKKGFLRRSLIVDVRLGSKYISAMIGFLRKHN